MNPVWTRFLFKERKVWSNLSLSELNNINYGFEISDNLVAGVGRRGEERNPADVDQRGPSWFWIIVEML